MPRAPSVANRPRWLPARRSAELDLPVDVLVELPAVDRQPALGLQRLVAFELARLDRLPHRLLDFALAGDANDLQELADFHVECVFVHGTPPVCRMFRQ